MFKKKIAIINGQEFFYWEKNEKKKDVVGLLHGFPGSHQGMVDMANGLEEYRIIIPDLPACGLSQPLKIKHSLENYSIWLDEFLKCLSIDKIILIGHSFGSRVALVFSGLYPNKVSKLVLITPVVRVEGLVARFVVAEYKIAEILPEYLRKSWLSNKLHSTIRDAIIFKSVSPKRRRELIIRENKEAKILDPKVSIEIFEEFYRFNLTPAGKKVKVKSLVLAGDSDVIAPLDPVRELTLQLEDCTFVIMGI